MRDLSNLPALQFPTGFWWGSATAGHQIEGDNVNCQDYHDEMHDPGGRRKAAGKIPSGKACDHWNRWREDLDLLGELGHQAWRFSIEWSRIEPAPGQVNDDAVVHYLAVCQRLADLKIRPVITLCHWTHPQWFEELGGFAKEANLVHWERHVDRIGRLFGPFAAAWIPLNEVEGAAGGRMEYAWGYARANAIAYHTLKRHSAAPAGIAAGAAGSVYPLREFDEADRALAAWRQWQNCGWWHHMIRTGELVLLGQDARAVPDAKGATDWWMLNYYRRRFADARKASGAGECPCWGIHRVLTAPEGDSKGKRFEQDEIHPDTLVRVLEGLRDKPVLISENGIATDDDRWRVYSLGVHLAAVHRAIAQGADVRGYLHWTTMDNYEWGSFVPRFGLVHVDFDTFARTPKPSAWFYRDVIGANALTPAIVARHHAAHA
jgi:beta-glucosidase